MLDPINISITAVALSFVALVQIGLFFIRGKMSGNTPASYRVTLLGPPGSGKTSAAIAVLDYMINSDMSGYLRLRGSATIEGVERGAIMLGKGVFPDRTLETSTNVYRLDYFPPKRFVQRALSYVLPIPKSYRVEIADFAGELTDEFSSSTDPFRREAVPSSFGEDAAMNYLKWVSESDRCLLFVDMERFVNEGLEYANALTINYIAFWQRYLDLHMAKLEPRAGTPVVIVHSKCDVFRPTTPPNSISAYEEMERILSSREMMASAFYRLYHYMRENSKSVEIVEISVVLGQGDTSRQGIDILSRSVLP